MRGLLMVECLYHQTVKGKKTMTRRSGGLELVNEKPYDWTLGRMSVNESEGSGSRQQLFLNKHNEPQMCTPRYKVGEVLYLKEPVSVNLDPKKNFYYYDLAPDHDYRDRKRFKWPNKLFMPASAARHFIKITGIKCERLFDISGEDCIAEGIENMGFHGWKDYGKERGFELTAMESFISLYKFANKTKEVPNLWVWVYSYEYLKDYKI